MDKLQRAGRDFLMRLVAKHGLHGAARILWALADELDGLAGLAIQAQGASLRPALTMRLRGSGARWRR